MLAPTPTAMPIARDGRWKLRGSEEEGKKKGHDPFIEQSFNYSYKPHPLMSGADPGILKWGVQQNFLQKGPTTYSRQFVLEIQKKKKKGGGGGPPGPAPEWNVLLTSHSNIHLLCTAIFSQKKCILEIIVLSMLDQRFILQVFQYIVIIMCIVVISTCVMSCLITSLSSLSSV
jgi:hypothetical protein